jgi:peptidoglycan hydrolase-like protein with peptidoglycan-binding domain
MRRRLLIGSAALAAIVAGAVATDVLGSRGPGNQPQPAAVTTATAQIVRTNLVDRQQVSATLGYGATFHLVNHVPGTLTWEAAVGTVVDRGQALYAIDSKSVYLMIGPVPAYRDLHVGVSDGADVKQLQENLIALGFGAAYNLTADGHFDWYTKDAVQRWQHSLGITEDGQIPLGLVVFSPTPIRISSWLEAASEQAGPGSPVAAVTSNNHVITLNLDARRQALAVTGAAVTVTLPNGSSTAGHIASVGTTATAPDQASGGGPPTIPVYIALDDPKVGGTVDQAPVTVGLAGRSASHVLAVPVNALLAQPDGGSEIEVVRAGHHDLVPVTTGLFAGGLVEISGTGFAEGDSVVVPAQ